MKLKLQKAYSKKLVLLLLLLTGSMNFSFSLLKAASFNQDQELSITTEVGEQFQDLRDGSLPTVLSLQFFRLNYCGVLPPYQYLSDAETFNSTAYIRSSRKIEPALNDTRIIYPFHAFL